MTPANILTDDQKAALTTSIREFHAWLKKTLPGSRLSEWDKIHFSKPVRDDWIMWVDEEKKEVHFNPYVLAKCSFAYFELIVIHEWFHLAVQCLPNKTDARLIKHGFGEAMMKLLDVEADYYAAKFLKQCRSANLIDLLTLYAEGSRVFGDPRVHIPKLERFIGSVLSIAHMYFETPTNKPIKDADLFLPTLVGIHVDEMLYTVVARNYHFVLRPIHANAQDLADVTRAYINVGNLTTLGYVDLLLRFAQKALARPIPAQVKKQFTALSA